MKKNLNNIRVSYSTLFLNADWHSKIIGMLVGLLMIAIYLWILSGLGSLLSYLYKAITIGKWSQGAEVMIKDVVTMLAAFELIRTLQSYLKLGRVKVTFILDAALVVLIGELISLWYRDYNWTEVFVSVSVISVLVFLRTLRVDIHRTFLIKKNDSFKIKNPSLDI